MTYVAKVCQPILNSEVTMKLRALMASTALAATLGTGAVADGHGWSLKDAAAPYDGTTFDVVFPLRPG